MDTSEETVTAEKSEWHDGIVRCVCDCLNVCQKIATDESEHTALRLQAVEKAAQVLSAIYGPTIARSSDWESGYFVSP